MKPPAMIDTANNNEPTNRLSARAMGESCGEFAALEK
jgi:hypothetical protein